MTSHEVSYPRALVVSGATLRATLTGLVGFDQYKLPSIQGWYSAEYYWRHWFGDRRGWWGRGGEGRRHSMGLVAIFIALLPRKDCHVCILYRPFYCPAKSERLLSFSLYEHARRGSTYTVPQDHQSLFIIAATCQCNNSSSQLDWSFILNNNCCSSLSTMSCRQLLICLNKYSWIQNVQIKWSLQ